MTSSMNSIGPERQRNAALWMLGLFFCFSADVQDGLGPFLGVRLQELGWTPEAIGWILTLPALFGLAFAPLLGAFTDRFRHKRGLLTVATLVVLCASLASMTGNAPLVAASQIASGIACAAFVPASTALILGLASGLSLPMLLGRMEAAKHVGTCLAAALAGLIGLLGFGGLGTQSAFYVMTFFGVVSLAALAGISPRLIDDDAARGLGDENVGAESVREFFSDSALFVFGLAVFFFHLGNAAMLPLLGQAAVARFGVDPSGATGATIFLAQITMVAAALAGARLVRAKGYGIVVLIAFAVLFVRGLVAGFWSSAWAIVPVQILDGVGAGLMGVATPGLVASLLSGTGRINLGLGSVLLMQGVGAGLSNALGGHAVQLWGYEGAFVALAAAPVVGLMVFLYGLRNRRMREAVGKTH